MNHVPTIATPLGAILLTALIDGNPLGPPVETELQPSGTWLARWNTDRFDLALSIFHLPLEL